MTKTTERVLFVEPNTVIEDTKRNIKYTIKKLIGQGGFAQCFLATSGSTERAVKVVRKSDITKTSERQKLLSEIKIHSSLSHKNIVKLIHSFEDKKCVYMVMEICQNKTLAEYLKIKKRLGEREVRKYVYEILNAVFYLHSMKIAHRDLKLGNLFLDENMSIKVGDFGLATIIEDGTRKKTICGTPNYIAPEILFGKAVGHSFEVDIWSTGVIIYTLLVGKPPFQPERMVRDKQNKEIKQIYRNIKENNYNFPEDVVLSKYAKELISGILDPNPETRFKISDIIMHKFLNTNDTAPQSKMNLVETIYFKLQTGTLQRRYSPRVNVLLHCMRLKNGVAYLMKNGVSGIHFNDSTSLLLDRHGRNVEFLEHKVMNGQRVVVKEKYLREDIPAGLCAKNAVLANFAAAAKMHMIGKKTALQIIEDADLPPAADFLVKMLVTAKALIFRYSNKVILFDFTDKTKIVIYDEGAAVMYLDRCWSPIEVFDEEKLRTCLAIFKELLHR